MEIWIQILTLGPWLIHQADSAHEKNNYINFPISVYAVDLVLYFVYFCTPHKNLEFRQLQSFIILEFPAQNFF